MLREKGLLDVLTHQVGAVYISDLPKGEYRNELINCINNLKGEDYPLNEWLDVLDYLGGTKQACKSPEECRSKLLAIL